MEKLYYLGPKGTYSEKSALEFLKILPKKYTQEPISTINKIVDLLEKNPTCVGVLPIENSVEGIVRQTIDSLYISNVKIQAQIEIKIEHYLYSRGEKKDIKHIISHPQALSQCQQYILNNFDKNIDLIHANSTAAAVLSLKDKDKTHGAIGSLESNLNLGFNVIDKNINDNKDNKTRFVLASKDDLKIGEKTRTSLVFNTKNEPGALLSILEIFKKYDLNLVYIESRPSKKVFGEYNFFVDINKGIEKIEKPLKEVEEACNYYKFLGSYPIL